MSEPERKLGDSEASEKQNAGSGKVSDGTTVAKPNTKTPKAAEKTDNGKKGRNIGKKIGDMLMSIKKIPIAIWAYFADMFINEKSAFWTMVFTGVLCVFTYWLYQVADRTDETNRATQRAFVSFTSLQTGLRFIDPATQKIAAYPVHASWENSGTTPAIHVLARTNFKWQKEPLPPKFDFPDAPNRQARAFDMGPKNGSLSPPIVIPTEVLNNIKQGKLHMYIWGWATYHDIFKDSREHRTEFCSEIAAVTSTSDDLGDPNTKVNLGVENCEKHNCSDDECKENRE